MNSKDNNEKDDLFLALKFDCAKYEYNQWKQIKKQIEDSKGYSLEFLERIPKTSTNIRHRSEKKVLHICNERIEAFRREQIDILEKLS